MDYFWSNFGDHLRGEKSQNDFSIRRLLLWPALLIGGFVLYGLLKEKGLDGYALPAAGLFALIKMWHAVRRWKERQKNRYKSSPLSRDELTKARSKLIRNTSL